MSQGDAIALCNLLSNLGTSKQALSSAGIYVGEGLLPVPAKLAEKIKHWEFVEVVDLVSIEFQGNRTIWTEARYIMS